MWPVISPRLRQSKHISSSSQRSIGRSTTGGSSAPERRRSAGEARSSVRSRTPFVTTSLSTRSLACFPGDSKASTAALFVTLCLTDRVSWIVSSFFFVRSFRALSAGGSLSLYFAANGLSPMDGPLLAARRRLAIGLPSVEKIYRTQSVELFRDIEILPTYFYRE